MREHRGNQSIISVALNALLAYPIDPYLSDFSVCLNRLL